MNRYCLMHEVWTAAAFATVVCLLAACGGRQRVEENNSSNDDTGVEQALGPEGLPQPEFSHDLVDARVAVAAPECVSSRAVIVSRAGAVEVFGDLVSGWSRLEDGDLLFVCPGVHNIQSTLFVEHLSDVVLAGNESAIVATVDDTVVNVENSRNIVIDGLRIVHDVGEYCLHNCLQVIDSERVTISNNQIDGSGYTGLVLIDSQELRVVDNRIHNCEYATSSYNVIDAEVAGNHLFGNRSENFDSNLINAVGYDELRSRNRVEPVAPGPRGDTFFRF